MDRKKIIQAAIFVFFVSLQPIQTKIFSYQSTALTFEEALHFCQNEFPEGNLAIIKDETSKQAVLKFLKENSHAFHGKSKKLF